jgi:hypothetical protein
MHQQPPHAPRGPKSLSKSRQRAFVSGTIFNIAAEGILDSERSAEERKR